MRHNIEVAHRLFEMPGKCRQIHGHSMWVEMKIFAPLNEAGVAGGFEFGDVKRTFREYLDTWYDHHLLLNEKDPWAGCLATKANIDAYYHEQPTPAQEFQQLPGLYQVPGDPTTENIAKWIAEWGVLRFKNPVEVIVHETSVNSAGYALYPEEGFSIENQSGVRTDVSG